jgi:hypothetical protein
MNTEVCSCGGITLSLDDCHLLFLFCLLN